MSGSVAALYATAPTPGALNELAEVEYVACALGTPLMPWQRQFIRVATEYTLKGGLRIYRYGTVVLTVPRQSGKTTVVRALLLTRALRTPFRSAFLTAQTGKDARERFFELVEQVGRSPIAAVTKLRAAADSTRLMLSNGSRIAPFVPNPEALHGYNFSDLLMDEIFALDEVVGDGILGAAIPAMQTHKDQQTILISTKGTTSSTFLNRFIDQGRAAVEDPDAALAYFEWALAPGLDENDEENWAFHPALGHTIDTDVIHAAKAVLSPGEFNRAFMNRVTEVAESILPVEAWNDQAVDELPPPSSRREITYGFEVAADRSRSAIIAAWHTDQGIALKPVRTGYGTDWLPDALADIRDLSPRGIACDRTAQNTVIIDALAALRPDATVETMTAGNFGAACAGLVAAVEDQRIIHPGDAGFDYAIATAQSRSFGDGGWSLSHKSQPEVVAAAVALRALTTTEAEISPEFYFAE